MTAPTLWSLPLGNGGAEGLYLTYSLIVATFLGTMGLPHVVVRFYTNPDGRAARRTTLVVLALLGIFYLLPPVYGALGRVYGESARSDVLVLELPRLMVPGIGRRAAGRARHRRGVRGVPVHLVGPVDRGGRRDLPGRVRPGRAARGDRLPAGDRGGRDGARR